MDLGLETTPLDTTSSFPERYPCRVPKEVGYPLAHPPHNSLAPEPPRSQSTPIPTSMPCSPHPSPIMEETVNLSDGMRIIARDLMEMKFDLRSLCVNIQELARESSDELHDTEDYLTDEDLSTSEFSVDCPICQMERKLDTQILQRDLKRNFCLLAENMSATFTELLKVYTVTREIRDRTFQVQLYQALNSLYARLYTVKTGVADIHQKLAGAGLSPQAWFEQEVDDRADEINKLLTLEAALEHQSAHVADSGTCEEDGEDLNSDTSRGKLVMTSSKA